MQAAGIQTGLNNKGKVRDSAPGKPELGWAAGLACSSSGTAGGNVTVPCKEGHLGEWG